MKTKTKQQLILSATQKELLSILFRVAITVKHKHYYYKAISLSNGLGRATRIYQKNNYGWSREGVTRIFNELLGKGILTRATIRNNFSPNNSKVFYLIESSRCPQPE